MMYKDTMRPRIILSLWIQPYLLRKVHLGCHSMTLWLHFFFVSEDGGMPQTTKFQYIGIMIINQ